MAEIEPGRACRFLIWPAPEGVGTPLTWGQDGLLTWAYFGAQRSAVSPSTYEFTGVGTLFAHDGRNGKMTVMGDRLGIQPIHYSQDQNGVWHVSTHLMWLLLTLGHDGTVNSSSFLAHMSFGYTGRPHDELYSGVRKLPPAGRLVITMREVTQDVYWSPPMPCCKMEPGQLPVLAEALKASMQSITAGDSLCLGLTAGKDSLCLASVIDENVKPLTATFGILNCADQQQAEKISVELSWPHVFGTVCGPNEFSMWASYVAFHSAGLTTASYVDMAAFMGKLIPPGRTFVIGEGGECVRDFFRAGGRPPMETLQRDYMTSVEFLKRTLTPERAGQLGNYPHEMLACVRAGAKQSNDDAFANYFYRHQRMPGNFSLRHAVLSTLRAKISPFLDSQFINHAYGLELDWHTDSRLHRALIAQARPHLTNYFDSPIRTMQTVQEWPARFSGEIGPVVYRLLKETLPFCEDVFQQEGTLALCKETIARPSKAIYHLFRVLSFSLARQALRAETKKRLAEIPCVPIVKATLLA